MKVRQGCRGSKTAHQRSACSQDVPIIKLSVPSTVSFLYFKHSCTSSTLKKKVSTGGTWCIQVNSHNSWHFTVVSVRLLRHFGHPGCFLSPVQKGIIYRYIQGGINVNEHQVKKQNCLCACSLQPDQHLLGFPHVRSFTSSKMLYSTHILTEKKSTHLYFPQLLTTVEKRW